MTLFKTTPNGDIVYVKPVARKETDAKRNPYREGYGRQIPTGHMIKTESNGPWRRVYVACYSNCGTAWVWIKGEMVCADGM